MKNGRWIFVLVHSLSRESRANRSSAIFVSYYGRSFVYIATTHRSFFKVGSKWIKKTSNGSSIVFIRLWLLQVFTVLCLIFENSKFIENLIVKDSVPSNSSSSLIQVISEESSQEPDSSLWSLPSLDSLCDLHPLLHSILSSHSSGLLSFDFFI